jgi:hypothetical protein
MAMAIQQTRTVQPAISRVVMIARSLAAEVPAATLVGTVVRALASVVLVGLSVG